MPKEKIETILLYNEADVTNLYHIYTSWNEYINKDAEETIAGNNLEEKNIDLEEKIDEDLKKDKE